MRPSLGLSHRVTTQRLFGPVAHGDDRAGSDLDISVPSAQEATLMDIAAIQYELQQLLGTPVDMLTPRAIPDHFRSAVEQETTPL